MTRWQEEMAQRHLQAKLHRKRGEALRRKGDETSAAAEFRAGVTVLEQIVDELRRQSQWHDGGLSPSGDPWDGQVEIARELVEAYGARGGMLRRLDAADEALKSYREGASLEERFVQRSTYNRVNAVKFALLSGASSLEGLSAGIVHLETLLTRQLSEDQELGDSGWAWADLGDCRALLGDVEGAERAYRTFVEKAGTNAPLATLDILRGILEQLELTKDPKATAVAASLTALEARLG